MSTTGPRNSGLPDKLARRSEPDNAANRSGTDDGPLSQKNDRNHQFIPTPPISTSAIPSAPTLSLPKGGGAIRGTGEKLDVNLCTGAASASFPIHTSSSRADLNPQLSLTYSSSSGNGAFGLGWQLSVPKITRKTEKGLPRYCDGGSDQDSDIFVLSEMEDLVPLFQRDAQNGVVFGQDGKPAFHQTIQDGFIIRRYASRIEGQFHRIERWMSLNDPNDTYWRTISPQNVTSIFGNNDSSRIYDPTTGEGGSQKIFSWLIAETYDSKGNAMIFQYKSEDSVNVPIHQANELNRTTLGRSANRYLKSVKYCNQVPNRQLNDWSPISAFSLPSDAWKFSVIFDYGEHDPSKPKPDEAEAWKCRSDPFSNFRSGFEVRTYRLCRRVLMYHHFEELDLKDYLVASTNIEYEENPTATTLRAIVQAGYTWDSMENSYTRKTLPPTEFGYSSFPNDGQLSQLVVQQVDSDSLENLPIGLDGLNYQWVDLDGEGLCGLLSDQGGSWYYKRNTSANNVMSKKGTSAEGGMLQARLESVEEISTIPSASITGGQMRFEDISGTGKLDLVQTNRDFWGYFERTEEGGWLSLQTFQAYPNLDTKDSNVKFVDLTGDGLADILIYADQIFYWHSSLGERGYGPGNASTQPNNEDFGPTCVFADAQQTIYLADMSGDGLADLVRVENGDICYWPNVGFARFGALVRMDNAPCFDSVGTFNQKYLRLSDIDGSGTTDMLYFGRDGVDVYLNQSGNSFSNRKHLPSFMPVDSLSSLNVIDLLGNGTMCICWSTSAPAASKSTIQYVDLMPGKKPYLLEKVVNNLGTEKEIHYSPSTKFYLDDKQAGNPWVTRLPFPVHCVDRIEVVDRISSNRFVSQYTYHHGFYDGLEREFRGFARVEQWDSEEFSSINKFDATNVDSSWHVPPVHTKTWFHTGAYLKNRAISRQLSSEYFAKSSSGNQSFLYSLDDTVLPPSLDSRQQIEVFRALKGQILRTEVYSDDGSERSRIPYSFREANFTVFPVQSTLDAHHHAVYFVHPRESISSQVERNVEDARIQHELILQVDSFGNILKSLKAAYGRQAGESQLTGNDKLRQETSQLVYSEFDFTTKVDSVSNYHVPMPCETRQYELSAFKPGASGWFQLTDLTQDSFRAILTVPEIPFEAALGSAIPQRRLIRQSRMLYRKDDLSGLLSLGHLEPMALPGQVYEMALTPGLIAKVFQRRSIDGTRENLLTEPKNILGGIDVRQAGYVDLDGDSRWWKPSSTISYTANAAANPAQELGVARQSFFSAQSFINPFKNASVVTYDRYFMFPVVIKDPVGNTTNSVMDYRALKPSMIISENGTRSVATFDALGLVIGTAVMGNSTEDLGDSLANFNANLSDDEIEAFFAAPTASSAASLLGNATTRVVYDRERYWRGAKKTQPTYTAVISRQRHVNDPSPAIDSKIGLLFTYSDGFGRDIQRKSLTKPGPLVDQGPVYNSRWIGSGWTIYNNKGKPVMQFEEFFDDTHDFKFDMKIGVTPIIVYDPLVRVVATLRPDRSMDKTHFDPWTQTVYDGNDNVLLSNPKADPDVGNFFDSVPEEYYSPSWYNDRIGGSMGQDQKSAAVKTAVHSDTPRTTHIDALGRAILVTDDNGGNVKFSRSTSYDMLGNELETRDAMNRAVMRCDYNMCGDKIHQTSMDSGDEWYLSDVIGRELYRWNSRGFRFRTAYDTVRRPIQLWAQEGDATEMLVESSVYGESSPDANVYNLRGKIWQIKDQAGLLTNAYDSKGNLVNSERKFTKEYKDLLDLNNQSFSLEDAVHSTKSTYDAMNRPVRSITPDMSTTYRVYNENGLLDRTLVNIRGEQSDPEPTHWTAIISNIDYNAKGQATIINYGNGAVTRRTFDKYTFRLIRQQAIRQGDALQDLNYTYDPMGNVTFIRDNAQQTVFFRNARVDPSSDYTYDPTYRLISATGREHMGQTNGSPSMPSVPGPFDPSNTRHESPGDGNAMATYTESYVYDPAGNILSMAHAGNDPRAPSWKRTYTYSEPSLLETGKPSNRLSSTTIAAATENYKYDAHGNMTSMGNLTMHWDFKNQLRATTRQLVTNGGIPGTTYYVNDTTGQRVRKVTDRETASPITATRMKQRLYFPGFEMFHQFDVAGNSVKLERVTLQIETDSGRVADIDSRIKGTDEGTERLIRYQLNNHLGSSSIELDGQSRIISYEEYYPFGSSSYQGVTSMTEVPKRYRFSGKEHDSESGLYFFGARYYASWLGRWTAVDSVGEGHEPYVFVKNNPVKLIDPDGRDPQDAAGGWIKGDNTGVMGTAIHKATLAELAIRSTTELKIPATFEARTTKGGSRNVRSNYRGRVDFVQLFPDPKALGDAIAQIYDLKPKTTDPATIQEYISQVDHYTDYKFEEKQLGFNVTQLQFGRVLSFVEKTNPNFFRPIYFEYGNLEIKVEVSVAKDAKGQSIEGLLFYEWYYRVKGEPVKVPVPVPKELTEEEKKMYMENQLNKMRVPIFATPGSQAGFGGRITASAAGSVPTVVAGGALLLTSGGVIIVEGLPLLASAAPAAAAAESGGVGSLIWGGITGGLRAAGGLAATGTMWLLGGKQDKGKN
jgi:RHS repeat-associated protein